MNSCRVENLGPLNLYAEKDDAKVNPLNLQDDMEETCVEFSKTTAETYLEARESECHHTIQSEKPDQKSFSPDEPGNSSYEKSLSQCCDMADPTVVEDILHQFNELSIEGNPAVQEISSSKVCDSLLNTKNHAQGIVPQSVADNDNQNGDIGTINHKKGKYFYYETPLHEETGIWIPVSIPPMMKNGELAGGFSSNGGYIPDEDMGWGQCIEEDKELTMWDVVVEMLLAARGKVSALTSGDISQISWMTDHLIEHSWKEMAQSLTEANFSNVQEIIDSDPPKWLPDSAASSCMLCNAKFHPIMSTRHHCRFCGGVFCNDCTKGRSLLPIKFRTENPQRICDVCFVRLEPVQPYFMDQVSRAAQLPIHDLTDLSTLRSWVNFPWGQTMEYEIYKATNTIVGYSKVGSIRPEKRIPRAILQDAKGLAILTVVRVGMMATYNIGTGLVLARREGGSWSPPSAISSFGVGWGAQAGGELTDFIIVLRTHDAVKTFCNETHFSFGAGLSAAAGTIGRTAAADIRGGPSGFAACYTYSCSKGAFIGCSLEGSIVTIRARENARFYGWQSITPSKILLGTLPQPPAAAMLYRALGDLFLQIEQ